MVTKLLLSKIRFFILASLVAVCIAASGCSSAPTSAAKSSDDFLRDYTQEKEKLEKTTVVSPGFKLRVHHSADDQISGEYRVDFKGYLNLPFKVKLRVAGMKTDAVEKALEQAYSPYFKVRNNVTVEILSRDYMVEVRGLVSKPGQYIIKLDTNMEEVMAMGGALANNSSGGENKTNTPKPEYVRIVTPEFMYPDGKQHVRWIRLTDYFLRYDPRNEVLWRGGEQLFFQMTADQEALRSGLSQTVQVMGEVHRPGEYPLQNGADLYSYIGQAGGPTSTADLGNIVIINKKEDDSRTVDLVKTTGPIELHPGDVILLKSTQVRPGFIERLGPFFVSLGSLAVSVVVALIAL